MHKVEQHTFMLLVFYGGFVGIFFHRRTNGESVAVRKDLRLVVRIVTGRSPI